MGESTSGFFISVISLIVLSSTWRFHDLLLIPGWIQRGKCHRRSFWKIPWSSTLQTVSAIFLFSLIAPHRRDFQYASHPPCALGEMHCTLTMEQVRWSSFDQFWAVFHGELLGDDVISWPYSFKVWNNTFRDFEALGLWTYVIGVAVPKYVYNSFPSKAWGCKSFDVRWNALSWGSEVFRNWKVTYNKIQYNTLSS